MSAEQSAWVDASAGVAGDMLLGALLDSGVSLDPVRAAIDAVNPGGVELAVTTVTRAGLRATKLSVTAGPSTTSIRHWRELRSVLERASLPETVRRNAIAVFQSLAAAEASVHGVPAEDVHFHEVGAWDSIADVVGVCAAFEELDVVAISTGPIALGSGHVSTQHGELPVPVPAVLELAHGWTVSGGGSGELATPTGMALLTTLASQVAALPSMQVDAIGVGAGERDPAGRANVVRVVVGRAVAAPPVNTGDLVLEANVDDLDPRLWPLVLTALLEAGASDAWLSPIVMKKGRPAHTVHALVCAELALRVRSAMLANTSTIGVREVVVGKYALPRLWLPVQLPDGAVRVKVAHDGGRIVRATPEFEDVAELAAASGRAVLDVLTEASAAAVAAGLVPGAPTPPAG